MLFEGIGKVQEAEYKNGQLVGRSENGYFRITVFSDEIVKVHISKTPEFSENSYAVINQPDAGDFKIDESKEGYSITTAKLAVNLRKKDSVVSLLSNDGVILSKDEDGLGTGWLGDTVVTHKSKQKGERFIGLGEKTGPLDRAGHAYIHNNTDAFGYGDGSDPIYCSIPFFIGIHSKKVYGFFMDSTYRSNFNFGASNDRFTSYSADGGDLIYYLFHSEDIPGLLKSYTWLTGRMDLPPLWSIGYQQCRYSYYPEDEVLSIAKSFRDRGIPADTMVLDIHYMDKYKIFTWDEERFPDPKGMIDKLKSWGFNVVLILDPGIKTLEGYKPYEDGLEKDIFVKYPDGTNYTGEVWPGWCHFPDFTNPDAREWWSEQFKSITDVGVDGFWNDMNEIATWGQSLPEIIEFDWEGNKTSAREGRNAYGLMMARSSYEAGKNNLGGKRPFNLTRSAYAGIQRYSAVWTGDNTANEEHMLLGVRLVNSLGLSGVPFSGYDVGGFIGEASVQLYTRWITIAAFAPFFRGHTMINSRFSEPWTFGEETEDIARNYIEFRYKLTPYIYSSFYEASQNGLPVSRSLAISHPHEDLVYNSQYHNQYYFGQNILVCPVTSGATISKVYLPEGDWYDLYNGTVLESGEMLVESPLTRLPVFIKAGSLIPMQSKVQHLKEDHDGILELHVYNGEGTSEFTMYEDDGSSLDVADNYLVTQIRFDGVNKTLSVERTGDYKSKFARVRFILHGFEAGNFKIDGKELAFESEEICFFPPVSHFDPVIDPEPPETEMVLKAETLLNSKITVSWK